MTVSKLLPKPQAASFSTTGEAYFTKRRTISTPGESMARMSMGMCLSRNA